MGGEHGDDVAAAEIAGTQGAGQTSAAVGEGAIGEAPLAVDDGDAVAVSGLGPAEEAQRAERLMVGEVPFQPRLEAIALVHGRLPSGASSTEGAFR